jgi:hypothetical protein
MAKNHKTATSAPSAWIVNSLDRGRKSIKQNNVYLDDKEEFLIELYNPLQQSVLTEIKLNGQSISKSGLVLNPGQRYYLDCFLDDKKKFVFNTYDVDDSNETLNAIAKNGLLEVFFYKESVVTINNWNRFNTIVVDRYYPWNCFSGYYGTGTINTISTGSAYGNVYSSATGTTVGCGSAFTTTTNTGSLNPLVTTAINGTLNVNNTMYSDTNSLKTNLSSTRSIETGRVGKGDKSKQKFESVDMDFDNHYIASTIIQMLPNSRKPIETKEIDKSKVSIKNSDQVIDLIKKLSDLYESGILTEDEFTSKKVELLSKI